MTPNEAKETLVFYAKKLCEQGMVGTNEGNISIKAGNRIYMTPTSTNKDLLTPDLIAVTDLDGNWLEGPLKPTSETPMHTACYKIRPDITSVVHCHAPFSTAYAIARKEIYFENSPEAMILYGKVPVASYGTPGSDDIYRDLPELLMEYDTVLLANHGLLSVGDTCNSAYGKCLSLEMILKTMLIHKLVAPGDDNNLPEDECRKLLELGKAKHGIQKKQG